MGCGMSAGSSRNLSTPMTSKRRTPSNPRRGSTALEVLGGQSAVSTKYKLGKPLGRGSFASCRSATLCSDERVRVVVKTVLRTHEYFHEASVLREIEIMKLVNHPRCIRLHEALYDSTAIHLIEELASGGELFDRILEQGIFSEQDAFRVIQQVFEGVAYLHSIGVCHRDLKPENLLMVSDNPEDPRYNDVKIADFGLSSLKPALPETLNASMSTTCGTPDYIAPEVLLVATDVRQAYDNKVDVWAVGCVLYSMLSGAPPFAWSDDLSDLCHRILHADLNFPHPEWDHVSQDTINFVGWLLQVDPDLRPSAQQCLEHPLLSSRGRQLDTADLAIQQRLRDHLVSRRGAGPVQAVRACARMEALRRRSSASSAAALLPLTDGRNGAAADSCSPTGSGRAVS